MGKRWPLLMVSVACLTLAAALTCYTTREDSLPAAMWAAFFGQAGFTALALVCLDHALHVNRGRIAETVDRALQAHRGLMTKAIENERLRLEEIAQLATGEAPDDEPPRRIR